MLLGDRFHDKKPQSSPLDMSRRAIQYTMKAFEYSFEVRGSDSDSVIPHAQHDAFVIGGLQPHLHVDLLPRILHGIVQNV